MAYRIAGIDVHKKMVAVVIADVDVAGTWRFERRQLGTSPTQLRGLADWLVECEVDGSRHGIDGAVLAAGVGGAGARSGSRGRDRPTGALVPGRCIWRRRSPTTARAAGSGIFPMPNGW